MQYMLQHMLALQNKSKIRFSSVFNFYCNFFAIIITQHKIISYFKDGGGMYASYASPPIHFVRVFTQPSFEYCRFFIDLITLVSLLLYFC